MRMFVPVSFSAQFLENARAENSSERKTERQRERERESDCVGARLFHSKSKFHSIDLSIYLYM